nr:VWA domain-containing protein [Parahaliea mediterranea]
MSLELEEWVGARWHHWASRARSYPTYPDAAVTLATIAPALSVFFRIAGGDPGLPIHAISSRESRHRLTLRQRLGFDSEMLERPSRSQEAVQLPVRIDVFPRRQLNRELYYWLAAFLASAKAPARDTDALRADIRALRLARQASCNVLGEFPGLFALHQRLSAAALNARPPRGQLPPAEAAIEAAVRALLTGTTLASDPVLEAVFDRSRSLDDIHAPRGYRSFLPVPLWGVVEPGATCTRDAPAGDDDPRIEGDGQSVAGGARKASRKRQDQSERDDPLVFNRFEKMLSFAEMVNLNRMVDDEPDDKAGRTAEQLDQLTLSPHIKRAASRLNVELELAPDTVLAGQLEGEFTYPEWDYRKQRYLPKQSRVLTGLHSESSKPWHPDAATHRRVLRVQRQFEALRPRRVVLRGQRDGPDLDTDAVVRAYCDQVATGVPAEHLYLAARPQARDLAVNVLVDNSLSTEAWLEDRRIIDVSREALWVLAHGLARCGDDYAIATFTSHRRHRVRINHIKTFQEQTGARVDRRIAALEPGSYTRMGPAIRHATFELAQRPNRHRLLLLISDGKPNDTDYYEGRYAIEDTRRAVLDARQQQIRVFAITIDREAGQYIPRLFGRGAYAMVRRPENLVAALPRLYRQITHGAV